jgi:hypothetical protein
MLPFSHSLVLTDHQSLTGLTNEPPRKAHVLLPANVPV